MSLKEEARFLHIYKDPNESREEYRLRCRSIIQARSNTLEEQRIDRLAQETQIILQEELSTQGFMI